MNEKEKGNRSKKSNRKKKSKIQDELKENNYF